MAAQPPISTLTQEGADIAIIGMAAHLPGAEDAAQYWQNLRAGLSAIRRLGDDDLRAAGEDPARMALPNYVPHAAPLDGFAEFDAEFWGFSPKDAAILDPQHRQFLEVAWEALENAGQMPERVPGPIGVFAGCGMGSYFYFNLCSNPALVDDVGMFLLRHTGNDKDFLSTRLSHILDLRGPSVNVQTACSTSLVAVHYAVQALLTGECDMALAGGVTIELPHGRGYLYKENEILSPDGACHAFDHRAQGTVFGSGAGCVVLKRLSDAQRDGDHIWAVIKGTAINNDGAQKAGYLAPSVEGQARCIAEAQAVAGVSADTVGYVECHGTGTYLGDPIEVAALTEAFRETTDATGFCRIGSVKTNIGHLDTAAGVASLIKAALALHHKEMPPSLGYEAPNPAIDFETSPFRVNDALTPWPRGAHPRRAGVNSLGVGGTNAHAILEEAPARGESAPSDWPFELLTLSARGDKALDGTAARLGAHLRARADLPLADVAFTLSEGRRAFARRRVLVADDATDAADRIEKGERVFTHTALSDPDMVFLFPGGGAQYPGMARDLYETEPVFAEWMDRGLSHLQPKLDYDIRALWLPEPGGEGAAAEALKRPSVQLPLIMITEYALAQMLMGWGLTPAALIGHSMGENTAAAIAGVMAFEDCIDLVHLRGRLFDSVPAGGMLSVPLSEGALRPYLGDLDIASLNAPELTVVSGPDAALADLAARLAADGVETQRIAIDIAAHSRMLEGILPAFRAHLAQMRLSAPRIPVISNTTGQPLTPEQAQSPDYWVNHLRGTVRFADGVATLALRPNRIWLEVGPGKALSSLVKMSGKVPAQQVLSALRHPDEQVADDRHHLELLGRIWALGGPIDWTQLRGEGPRQRLPLPGYAFQRQRYFIEAQQGAAALAAPSVARIPDPADWASAPVWLPRTAGAEFDVDTELALFPRQTWLVFADRAGIAAPAIAALRGAGHKVFVVDPGDRFLRKGEDGYTLAPERGREGYEALVRDLSARGLSLDRIAHFWLCGDDVRPGSSPFQRNMERGFHGLVFLAQALASEGAAPAHLAIFTTGAANLRGEGLANPEKATILGPARVIPREMPGFTVSVTDVDRASALVLEELLAPPANTTAAIRGPRRYAQSLRAVPLPADADLPQGAVWVITGGFGGIGLSLAEDLIRRSGAKIALIARTALPARSDWPALPAADPRARRVAAVQRLEAMGGTVQVLAADVCNLDDMRAALDQVRTTLGPIHGVIHAAGAIDDAPMLAKTPAALDAVLSPKLHGLRVLDQLLPDGAVDRLVLFSSTSAHVAPAGQVDYVAANAYLNAFAAARAGGRTKVLALGWGVWADVGMAAEALAQRLGHAPSLPATPTGLPLLPEAGFDRAMNRQFTQVLGPDHWLLDEHRTRDGRALVPGTGVVELFLQAMHGHGQTGALTLRDVTFLRALEMDAPRPLRVTVARSDEGFDLTLRAEASVSGRKGFALHAMARAMPGGPRPAPLNLDAVLARCPNRASDAAGLRTTQEAHLAFGPRWRVLNMRALGTGEGVARLSLPTAFRADLDQGYLLHPALMDIATGWAMGLIDGYEGASLWVPVSYEALHVYAALPAEIASHVRLKPAPTGFARFDITLTDPAGNVLAEIEGFTMKRLESGLATPPLLPSEMEFDEAQSTNLNDGEARLARNLALGITPAEGAQAFVRALASSGAEVVISSLPLPALIAEAGQVRTTDGARFERPETSGDYIEPRNETERRLATIWEELLGINGIGMEDNFFDLGGHSLIAVRLFARVKKAFGADFPISILFEAPTIAGLAALIGTPESGAEPQRPARRFQFLVPMHDGEGGPRTPFFLVAGMFGNVLNLRQLAALLGRDRPFYGLQARGLFGEAPPHARLEDAARDYIAEIRQVQPHGPYLLGGFSGGGLTALEMARQLRAEGEDVALLTLLDTPLPLRPMLSRLDKALIKLQEFQRKGPAYAREWWQARQAWKAAQGHVAEDGEGFHNQAIEAAFRAALPHVALARYDGAVALFRPALDRHWRASGGRWISREKEYVSADNDWGPWMPALEVIEVPGNHDSMVLEPNVRVMAARLKTMIEGRAL